MSDDSQSSNLLKAEAGAPIIDSSFSADSALKDTNNNSSNNNGDIRADTYPPIVPPSSSSSSDSSAPPPASSSSSSPRKVAPVSAPPPAIIEDTHGGGGHGGGAHGGGADADEHDMLDEKKAPEVFDDALEALLKTEPLHGLTDEQVQERLLTFGFNEIKEVKTNPLLKFLSYFNGPIAWLIEAAVILAGVVKDWVDFSIILALLVVNALIGFIEEQKAESALDALRQTLALRSRVYRNGALTEVNSRELVPGDTIIVRLGDIVPADCRLLGIGGTGEATGELQIDQAALTGESLPVHKHRGDIAYSSSIVKQGQQLAIVAKTGDKTFIGRAANLIAITNEAGHFQKVVNRVGNFLIAITLVLVVVLLIILLVVQKYEVLVAINYALVLTIASIPVGLPTVLSVTMAVGAKQLAKRQVIIKRLPAVEEMAGISILCSDKTGTLTMNQLSLVEPYLKEGFTNEDLLFHGFLASEAGANDAIELACRNGAITQIPHLVGEDIQATNAKGYKAIAFKPFDPISKLTEATILRLEDGYQFKVAKGAPHVIIRLVGGDADASNTVQVYGKRGLRCLGIARTIGNTNKWELIGLLAFLDPPRPDSKITIERTKALGVSVKMITGDQLVIAKEVAHRLGLPRTILSADKLTDKNATEEQLTDRCVKADGFAQVIPEDKFRVVELLQKRGLLVGMTGDGVNDAPALKKANVGIAVHGCTDAARSAADVVLLAPGLSTIVDGIKTSRAIFQRMRSYALYRITSTIHFLIYFFFSIILLDFSLPAELIVLICLLNDAATLVISIDNAQISPKPDKWRLGQLLSMSVILAIMLTCSSFAHYFIARDVFGMSKGELYSIIYLQVSSCPHFMIFGTRVAKPFYTNRPSLVFFCAIVGTQIFAMFVSIYGILSSPIGWKWGVSVMCISIGYFCLMDAVKTYVYSIWSYELTATVCPTPKRRQKLRRLQEAAARKKRIEKTVNKVRKILLVEHTLMNWKSYHANPTTRPLLDSSVASSANNSGHSGDVEMTSVKGKEHVSTVVSHDHSDDE